MKEQEAESRTQTADLLPAMQPLYMDEHGTVRFHGNAAVQFLLDNGTQDILNRLVMQGFSQADMEQFYQLIGYSLRGYHELSRISDESAFMASALAREQWPDAGGCRDDGCPIHCGVQVEEARR